MPASTFQSESFQKMLVIGVQAKDLHLLFIKNYYKVMEKNSERGYCIPLFRKIEKSSEFTFFFNDNRVNVNKTVSVNAQNATLEDVLDQVLKNTGYKYQIIDRQVLIKASDNLSLASAQQNQKTVAGVILDESGLPVIGANVVVEPYCFIGDSCTLKSGTIVKSTSMVAMNTSTEQGSVLFTSLTKE